SEWNVAVFLRRIAIAFRAQRLERIDQPGTRVARVDDVVHVAAAGGDVRVRELLAILVDLLVGRIARIARRGDLTAKENLDRAGGPHDGDFRRRPGDVVVAADVLGAHDVVG